MNTRRAINNFKEAELAGWKIKKEDNIYKMYDSNQEAVGAYLEDESQFYTLDLAHTIRAFIADKNGHCVGWINDKNTFISAQKQNKTESYQVIQNTSGLAKPFLDTIKELKWEIEFDSENQVYKFYDNDRNFFYRNLTGMLSSSDEKACILYNKHEKEIAALIVDKQGRCIGYLDLEMNKTPYAMTEKKREETPSATQETSIPDRDAKVSAINRIDLLQTEIQIIGLAQALSTALMTSEQTDPECTAATVFFLDRQLIKLIKTLQKEYPTPTDEKLFNAPEQLLNRSLLELNDQLLEYAQEQNKLIVAEQRYEMFGSFGGFDQEAIAQTMDAIEQMEKEATQESDEDNLEAILMDKMISLQEIPNLETLVDGVFCTSFREIIKESNPTSKRAKK